MSDYINYDPLTNCVRITLTPPGTPDPIYDYIVKEWRDARTSLTFRAYVEKTYNGVLIDNNGTYTAMLFLTSERFTHLMLLV